MFLWQVCAVLIALGLSIWAFFFPPRGIMWKILRTLVAWLIPYAYITLSLIAFFTQDAWVSIIFLVQALTMYLFFIRTAPSPEKLLEEAE